MSLGGSNARTELETQAPATVGAVSSLLRQSGPWYARPVVVGLVVFLALLVVKFDTLSEPPAWDAAMSVHPAAITLAETGFDYPTLLALPGFADGGPNTHSLSIYTGVAGVAYALFDPKTAILILHLLSFVIGAMTSVALVRFGRNFLPTEAAIGVAMVSMTLPLVLTQFGLLYLDAPVLAATSWALVAAVENRWVASAGFSLLATGIKPSGAVTAAALALFFLIDRRSVKKALAIATPSAVVLGVQAILSPGFADPSPRRLGVVAYESAQHLVSVPDLLAIIVFATLVVWAGTNGNSRQSVQELGNVWSYFALSFLVFFGSLMSTGFRILPRYYILIAPLAIAMISVHVFDRYGPKIFYLSAATVLSFFVLNFDGIAYQQQSDNHFSVAERSDRYDQLLDLEIAASAAICDLPPEVPVWYSKAEAYRLEYPAMGYASCSPIGRAIINDTELRLDDLPKTVFVTFENPFLGGFALHKLINEAAASPDWNVRIYKRVEVGGFHQDIHRLTRTNSD